MKPFPLPPAYRSPDAALRTPRQIERQVIAAVTARLRAAAARPDSLPPLAQALHDNRRLWTHLAAAVADRSNALPADLRARLFALAEFAGRHSAQVLRGEGDVQVLIDINTAIMRGLDDAPPAGRAA